jgi:hypothetical protein
MNQILICYEQNGLVSFFYCRSRRYEIIRRKQVIHYWQGGGVNFRRRAASKPRFDKIPDIELEKMSVQEPVYGYMKSGQCHSSGR